MNPPNKLDEESTPLSSVSALVYNSLAFVRVCVDLHLTACADPARSEVREEERTILWL